jgi:hypothetical protein
MKIPPFFYFLFLLSEDITHDKTIPELKVKNNAKNETKDKNFNIEGFPIFFY